MVGSSFNYNNNNQEKKIKHEMEVICQRIYRINTGDKVSNVGVCWYYYKR